CRQRQLRRVRPSPPGPTGPGAGAFRDRCGRRRGSGRPGAGDRAESEQAGSQCRGSDPVEVVITPLLAILVSGVRALLIAVTGERRRNLREFWSVAAGVLQLALVASMIPDVLAGREPQIVLFRTLPGIDIAFRVDALGLLFALGAAL